MPLIAASDGPIVQSHARSVHTPSPQQADFYEAGIKCGEHIELTARAGSGKSTSIAELAHRMPRRSRLTYCAFNKSIAADMQPRVPSNCRAATMHSLGFAMLRDALGEVSVDANKTDILAERYFPDRFGDRDNRFAVTRLVSLCKNLLIDGRDIDAVASLAAEHDVSLGKQAAEILAVVPEILEESKAHTNTVDFDDMIWLPVAMGLEAERSSDVLFIDEAQDTNACQMELAWALCPEGRVIIVGDDRQAIYAFRGSDAAAIRTLSARLADTDRGLIRLPLTVTWRCPTSHVALANALVPDLEAAPGAIEGVIREVEEHEALADLKPGDMALCRTNAPLVGSCFRLIRSGRKAVVRGRDIGKGLLATLARLRAGSIEDLVRKIDDYRVRETVSLNELRNPGPLLVSLQDRVECLLALCDGAANVGDVKARIERLFSDDDERGAVVFSSIHRAKGLERDRITILHPELLPHPASNSPVSYLQEANLTYVAATRSRHTLTFAGPIPVLLQPESE